MDLFTPKCLIFRAKHIWILGSNPNPYQDFSEVSLMSPSKTDLFMEDCFWFYDFTILIGFVQDIVTYIALKWGFKEQETIQLPGTCYGFLIYVA